MYTQSYYLTCFIIIATEYIWIYIEVSAKENTDCIEIVLVKQINANWMAETSY